MGPDPTNGSKVKKCGSASLIALFAGNNQLRSPALPVIPAELAQGEHQEGGLLDHLQYHRRQQATNSGQSMYVAYHVSI